ncbi:hypothetical protein FQA39_LY17163 [Lamprigera yunnana]|nr:hypothetical protein FQA39_LY17163 [Lamprigera yunnana]
METAQILMNNNQNSTTQTITADIDLKANKNLNELRANFASQNGKLEVCYYRVNENGPGVMQHYENIEQQYEEPIDLTCTQKRVEYSSLNGNFHGNLKSTPTKCDSFAGGNVVTTNAKKRGRKRKTENKFKQSLIDLQLPLPVVEPDLLKNPETSHYVQNYDNKKVEVLKAAKSLFSKRTRTLYHWMCPDAPKAQLKAAVATSWETLSAQEKEFYISQVLGRFGFPQSNLMINPQLGGLSGTLSLIPTEFSTVNREAIEETSTAVSTILQENNRSWINETVCSSSSPYTKLISKTSVQKNKLKNKNKKYIKDNTIALNEVEDEVNDEFQDDPELSREFQQFKWNLHFNENKS